MSKRYIDQDSSGVISYRSWLYACDEFGVRIAATPRDFAGMHVHPTRNYLPAPSDTLTSQEERLARDGHVASAIASLTETEHDVLRLQGKLVERIERKVEIAAGDLVEYQRGGYTYVPDSGHVVERPGLPPLECVYVVGYERVEVEPMDHAAVAERLGLTVRQVRSAVESAQRKLKPRSV